MTKHLTRRERQILDLIHQRGEASAREVMQGLEDAPGYSAVRALLARMVERDLLRFEPRGRQYIYRPAESARQARLSAARHLADTFFSSSPVEAASALLGLQKRPLKAAELQQLKTLVEQLEQAPEAQDDE
ncbi:MAG: BlaI/MecI/CopY family transcriptional regulator [Pseudomonadota bacterium]